MRKILAAILAVTLMFSGFTYAIGGENIVELKIDSTNVAKGDIFTLSVNLNSFTGISAIAIPIKFDKTKVQIVNAITGEPSTGVGFSDASGVVAVDNSVIALSAVAGYPKINNNGLVSLMGYKKTSEISGNITTLTPICSITFKAIESGDTGIGIATKTDALYDTVCPDGALFSNSVSVNQVVTNVALPSQKIVFIDPNGFRVTLDGKDVTGTKYINSNDISQHKISIEPIVANGTIFTSKWEYSSVEFADETQLLTGTKTLKDYTFSLKDATDKNGYFRVKISVNNDAQTEQTLTFKIGTAAATISINPIVDTFDRLGQYTITANLSSMVGDVYWNSSQHDVLRIISTENRGQTVVVEVYNIGSNVELSAWWSEDINVCDGVKVNCPIKATSINISPNVTTAIVNQDVYFTAEVLPLNCLQKGIVWSATGGTIDANTGVFSCATAGDVTITARDEQLNMEKTQLITVQALPPNIPDVKNFNIVNNVDNSKDLLTIFGGTNGDTVTVDTNVYSVSATGELSQVVELNPNGGLLNITYISSGNTTNLQLTYPPQPTYAQGYVLKKGNRVVWNNVLVSVFDPMGGNVAVKTITTDENGRFDITGLKLGKYTLEFTCPGYLKRLVYNFDVNSATPYTITTEKYPVLLYPGDIVGANDSITDSDILHFLNSYYGAEKGDKRYSENYDFYRSKGVGMEEIQVIGIQDLSLLLSYKGSSSSNYPNIVFGR